MDAIAMGVSAYRNCIGLRGEVPDRELEPEVARIIKYAKRGNNLAAVKFEIARWLAHIFPRLTTTNAGRENLADGIMELANADRN
jgi:hypothetical protein